MALPLETTIKAAEATRPYTTEEFMALSLDDGKRYELVKGVIHEMSQAGGRHSMISDNLYGVLRDFVRANQLGRVLPTAGYELKIDPERHTVRSPDLSFMPASRVSSLDDGAIKVAPELAIEVYSPQDEPGELRKKLEDYQLAGWNLVWVVFPITAKPKREAATIEIYRLQAETRLQPAQILTINDTLLGEESLSGFSTTVAALFEV